MTDFGWGFAFGVVACGLLVLTCLMWIDALGMQSWMGGWVIPFDIGMTMFTIPFWLIAGRAVVRWS